jgi:hypothetical protein
VNHGANTVLQIAHCNESEVRAPHIVSEAERVGVRFGRAAGPETIDRTKEGLRLLERTWPRASLSEDLPGQSISMTPLG